MIHQIGWDKFLHLKKKYLTWDKIQTKWFRILENSTQSIHALLYDEQFSSRQKILNTNIRVNY